MFRGPGSLILWWAWIVIAVAIPVIVGGANPESSVSTCAPTAWPESLIPLIASFLDCAGIHSRRTHGAAMPLLAVDFC